MNSEYLKHKLLLLALVIFFYSSHGICQLCYSSSRFSNIKINEKDLFSCAPIQAEIFATPAWARAYGGSSADQANSIQQTPDGGYIVAGWTSSFGAGGTDAWVLKLDASGTVVWQKTYGGSGDDFAKSIRQTPDGGYIVAGWTTSFGAGSNDAWVLKLDSSGGVVWQKTYGDSMTDFADYAEQTTDGGYIVAACKNASWILKLDANGAIIWQKTFNGNNCASVIQQTADGNYIAAGNNYGAGGDDVWLLKLDPNGTVIWQKSYGGSSSDWGYAFQQTTDGGYIIAGRTFSFGAGNDDALVLKLDANGAIVWQKTYGGVDYDHANAIGQTSDGGYIVAGRSDSFISWVSVWVFKLDAGGTIVWQKTYGGSDIGDSNSVQQTSDGGYVVAGWTYSYGAGASDLWVLKLDSNGGIAISCNFIEDTSITPISISIIPYASTFAEDIKTVVPSVSSATVQSTTVTPVEQCASSYTYLQPYLGAKPVVDDSGSSTQNGVIEPDESVFLQGHLQNIGTADAANTSGVLSTTDSITITQPNATYGTIAAGGNQICTTCYALIAPLTNRPATHWDFNVTEQVSADAYNPVNFNYTYHVGDSFSDVPPSQMFYSYIEKMLHSEVTGGCTATAYCPSTLVQRQSMAKFICAAMNSTAGSGYCSLQSTCQSIFSDVLASNIFCVYIEGLYNSGVVAGCKSSPLQYCPGNNVARDSMAKFICNAINHNSSGSCVPTSCTGIFTDVPASNPFCGYIEALYNKGIISGCGTNLYCPSLNVSRDQMAKFIVNAFGLTL